MPNYNIVVVIVVVVYFTKNIVKQEGRMNLFEMSFFRDINVVCFPAGTTKGLFKFNDPSGCFEFVTRNAGPE